ncbi:VOC family protein [Thermomicrobium sp. CFH 73360]|uniref:VOC family protein n=1 Tax=Thermomicrobium sp. CFH 73360 TaxID=2951987 RepID=UPI0020776852|nr:VOC family protein [Thermomicrobium sp. CFH 73360]MCM8746114.1 VOC family protein [Thermomicrobium sp. CFH 73360]
MHTMMLPATLELGPVTLRVADERLIRLFYRETLGYQLVPQADGCLAALPPGSAKPHFLFEITPEAPARPQRAPGLYHTAILLPTRTELARVLRHLVERRWPLLGASDHQVSEALYLTDPEGNGLEFYADRPPERWPRGTRESISMVTEPLDVRDLLRELDASPEPWQTMPVDARVGHVHLQVSGLDLAERFYVELLGFQVTQRSYPGALFVAAGDYHHHLGLNIWNSRRADPAPPGCRGLVRFAMVIPDRSAWSAALDRLERAGRPVERGLCGELGEGFRTRDYDDLELELWTPLEAD